MRYGFSYVPLDEALSRTVIDFSGRPYLSWDVDFTAPMIGALDSQLPREFFLALSTNAKMTLHIDNLKGINAHHQCESVLNLEERSAWLQPSMNALKCHSFYQRDTMKIAVVDYGSGNLRSVYQAIKKVVL